MSDNSAALRAGTAKLKQVISKHISGCLFNALDRLVQMAADRRAHAGHNMTGNTVNAYAGGLFVEGRLTDLVVCNAGHGPVRVKLRAGEKFVAGAKRWDGDTQEGTYTAEVDTDATKEPSAAISFIESYKAQPKGWVIVVANGVEYATFQETSKGIDVLTANYAKAETIIFSAFKPIPD